MDEFATARHRLQALAETDEAENRNEATTRLHLIDPLLMDCLGWQPEDVKAEDHANGQYADYVVGRPRPRMVVEAKREQPTFQLPVGVTARVLDLQTVIQDPPVKDAVTQVLGYCQERSIPVAVATNGHQLIGFLASRQDAVKPLLGKAVVFVSLADMLEDFPTFWELFSRHGFAQATLQRRLGVADAAASPPQKLSARSLNYPGFRQRSELETDLKILGQLFLLDITKEGEVSDDFLRECYCRSGALSQYALVSKEILRARYALVESTVSDTAPVYEKKTVSPKLSAAVLASALSRRPVLLIGNVGVGKTMFLRHLLRIEASEVLANSLVLYLDFGTEPAVADDLSSYVSGRIIDQLRDDYGIDLFEEAMVRAVYNAEINRFAKGIHRALATDDHAAFRARELAMLEELVNVKGEHVRRCLEHLRGTSRRNVVVVLDNVDQRPSSFQEQVFLIGEAMASGWPVTVFLALRPSTFHESRIRGSLSGYHSRVFTVYPARTDEVISKRLAFARRQLVETGRLETFPQGLSINSVSLLAYVDVLIAAFESSSELKELLDNLSGGNLRVALDFLSAFVGSGYVSTARILDVAATGDTYTIPIHEFFRAIAYGDAEQYDPASSPIANVLDITQDDGREHFLLPSLIVCAQSLGEAAGADGFVSVTDLFQQGSTWGFTQEQVGAQLERAFDANLIDADERVGESGRCRVTSVGAYTVRKLLPTFMYVDAVIVDTPIVDVTFRTQILPAWAILDRLSRALVFHKYLDRQWEKCAKSGLPLDWPSVSATLHAHLKDVELRAERAEARWRGE